MQPDVPPFLPSAGIALQSRGKISENLHSGRNRAEGRKSGGREESGGGREHAGAGPESLLRRVRRRLAGLPVPGHAEAGQSHILIHF